MFRLFRFLNVLRTFKRSWTYFSNPEIPKRYKILPVIGLIYLIHPLDFLSEFQIFGWGLIDDFFILYLTLYWFEKLSVNFLDRQKKDDFIDAKYEIRDKKEEE